MVARKPMLRRSGTRNKPRSGASTRRERRPVRTAGDGPLARRLAGVPAADRRRPARSPIREVPADCHRSVIMIADRAWVERNLGFDPVRDPPPEASFAVRAAAKAASPEDLQREV